MGVQQNTEWTGKGKKGNPMKKNKSLRVVRMAGSVKDRGFVKNLQKNQIKTCSLLIPGENRVTWIKYRTYGTSRGDGRLGKRNMTTESGRTISNDKVVSEENRKDEVKKRREFKCNKQKINKIWF